MSEQDSKLPHRDRGIDDGVDHRLELHRLAEHYAGDIDSRSRSPASSAVDL